MDNTTEVSVVYGCSDLCPVENLWKKLRVFHRPYRAYVFFHRADYFSHIPSTGFPQVLGGFPQENPEYNLFFLNEALYLKRPVGFRLFGSVYLWRWLMWISGSDLGGMTVIMRSRYAKSASDV